GHVVLQQREDVEQRDGIGPARNAHDDPMARLPHAPAAGSALHFRLQIDGFHAHGRPFSSGDKPSFLMACYGSWPLLMAFLLSRAARSSVAFARHPCASSARRYTFTSFGSMMGGGASTKAARTVMSSRTPPAAERSSSRSATSSGPDHGKPLSQRARRSAPSISLSPSLGLVQASRTPSVIMTTKSPGCRARRRGSASTC